MPQRQQMLTQPAVVENEILRENEGNSVTSVCGPYLLHVAFICIASLQTFDLCLENQLLSEATHLFQVNKNNS